jgi:hypothetical protein
MKYGKAVLQDITVIATVALLVLGARIASEANPGLQFLPVMVLTTLICGAFLTMLVCWLRSWRKHVERAETH